MSPKTSVLIVDDEPLARKRLRTLLEKEADMTVVAECGNGDEALKALFTLEPDILFLDIEMPGKNGFDVLQQLPASAQPFCIFVTAYSKYAVQAFEYEALDYLLKPFRNSRFQQALARARRHVQMRETTPASEPDAAPPRYLMTIDLYGSSVDLAADDMMWIQSDGNYIKIRTASSTYYKRATLSDAVELLEPQGFIRIHRSVLVNSAHVTEVVYRGNNEYEIATTEGAHFRSGRTYKQRIQAFQQKQ
ncbi:LytR/AlgR family response regulator transcription factor [Acanthopleuribacter pedis]|uniref:Response regulator n=1 Tax=Acanthopleuribacter pedis TaxID=442870 RepID=A0A8J7QQX7_9BACT|nr:response regulator [Acanthopleuribacter pedis]MBO1322555.1 response regulator [Acanthopleuribacter pedis]